MIIWLIIVITVILIIWLQSSNNTNEYKMKDRRKRTYCKYIFNKMKVPLIVVCLLVLVYLSYSTDDSNINQTEVFLSLPNF